MFFAATTVPALRRHAYSPASRSLERFLNDALTTSRQTGHGFEQDDKAYTLRFDVPGVAKEQLSIGIEGNVVRVETLEGAPRKYRAAYELPLDIDTATSEAKLENGVLTLKLAKLLPVSKVAQLAIN
jgi:HSP20 family molecular chaperone IbpA